MRRIVELAAASLPWAIRDRYREEWLHDLEHADEVGVRPRDIAWGAVRTAFTADRMQAPSTEHAILQARLRIDSGGTHALLTVMLGLIAMQSSSLDGGAVVVVLMVASLLHAIVMLVQLQLAALTLGGRVRFAVPAWALAVVVYGAGTTATMAGASPPSWLWPAGVFCCVAAAFLAESHKPAKPELRERVRPGMRRRLLMVGAITGALTVVLCQVETLVIVPLRRVRGASLGEAWSSISAAGGPASPLFAAALLLAITLVPITVGMIGAMRWARSERGMLGWAAGGALFGVIGTLAYCSSIAPLATLPPLLAGALLHLTTPAQRDLAPLPPASVPLPPGPWHLATAARSEEAPA